MTCDGNQMTKRDVSRLEIKAKEYIFSYFMHVHYKRVTCQLQRQKLCLYLDVTFKKRLANVSVKYTRNT